jgi:hypothetical protein
MFVCVLQSHLALYPLAILLFGVRACVGLETRQASIYFCEIQTIRTRITPHIPILHDAKKTMMMMMMSESGNSDMCVCRR